MWAQGTCLSIIHQLNEPFWPSVVWLVDLHTVNFASDARARR